MDLQSIEIERFWDKYIKITKGYKVSAGDVRWCVRRVEIYIKAHQGLRLAQHSDRTLEKYLKDLDCNDSIPDWKFTQTVLALKILFVEMVKPAWIANFPWDFWLHSAARLPPNHATIARAGCGIDWR
ncbi:MAG: hypothetical protein GXP19_09345 [Gammaproteobacteria bacterium]|nr:hypothetical protein [Gammaproteobacteria bacterium]